MKLNELIITGFRSIKETETIRVDNRVSVLIGANDHGKSNILKAIECLNDDCPFEEDDKNWDLDKSKDVRIEWHFKLDDGEDFSTRLNEQKLTEVTSPQEGRLEAQEQKFLEITSLPAEVQTELSRIVSLEPQTFTEEDKGFLLARRDYLTQEQRDKFSEFIEINELENTAETGEKVEEEHKYFGSNDQGEVVYFREGVDSPVKVLSVPTSNTDVEDEKYLLKMRPRVELFEAIPNNLKDKVNKKDIDKPEFEFMQGIFMLAGIWDQKDTIFNRTLVTERVLKDASARLTSALNRDWNQGKELSWMLSHNGTDIEIMIEDPAIGTRYTRPSTRSSGFKTYFVTSMVIKARTTKNPSHSHIYLFDEPGIYLHPKAQLDLQRAIELISDGAQIIYTTHSLFLINKNYPERNKVVSKTARGTKIDQKPYLNNWKSVKESLGILLSNNFLIADKTIVTEGPSDIIYLWYLIKNLKRNEKVDIDLNDICMVDAGESQNYVAITKVMLAEGRGILALVDGDDGGSRIKTELEKVCAEEIGDKKLQIKQLDGNKSIEDYALDTSTFKEAIKMVVNNLVKLKVRELKNENSLVGALKNVRKQKNKTLGKVLLDEFGSGKVFTDVKDNISKLSVALQYEEIAKDSLNLEDDSVKLIFEIKELLSLRGEKSAESGVFSETV